MPVNCPNGSRRYVVRAGDTLFLIAERFGVTVDQILAINPEITDPNRLSVGQEICVPRVTPSPGTCVGIVYVIQAGDTFYSLARRYNIDVNAIIAANPGVDPERLQIGQTICLPITPPVMRPRCQLLNPTDIAPGAKGFLFIEPDVNSIFAGVTNVPDPTVLPEGEVYKLWVRRRGTNVYAVAVMEEVAPDYYVARVVPDFPISQADAVLISSEQAANITAPAGLGVAETTLV